MSVRKEVDFVPLACKKCIKRKSVIFGLRYDLGYSRSKIDINYVSLSSFRQIVYGINIIAVATQLTGEQIFLPATKIK